MSSNATSNSTRMTIGAVGTAAGAAHGRDRNIPDNGSIQTSQTDSSPLAAPVAGMARSYKKAVRLQEIFPCPGQHRQKTFAPDGAATTVAA
jgi:hypothetical protein